METPSLGTGPTHAKIASGTPRFPNQSLCSLPISYCPLPNFLLPIAYDLLPIFYCRLPIALIVHLHNPGLARLYSMPPEPSSPPHRTKASLSTMLHQEAPALSRTISEATSRLVRTGAPRQVIIDNSHGARREKRVARL